MNDAVYKIIMIAWVAFAFFMIGLSSGTKYQHGKAIEAGAAHWQCDPKTGENTFVYDKKE